MKSISVRTRLMLMLLGISIAVCVVLGFLGSSYGDKTITTQTLQQLKLIRSAKETQIRTYFNTTQKLVEFIAQDEEVVDAAIDLTAAYESVPNEPLNEKQQRNLDEFYTSFLDSLSQNMEVVTDIDQYIPVENQTKRLQLLYTIGAAPGNIAVTTDIELNSYQVAHDAYHDKLKSFVDSGVFYDIFIVNLTSGDIVYSVTKETDFATNLYEGPYRGSNLASLTRSLRENTDFRTATFQDFAAYRPSYGAPAGFVGIPLNVNGRTVAGLIFQIPIDRINEIMTSNADWKANGLGETGETFLVGEDDLMRSDSRFYIENPELFKKDMIDAGTDPDVISRIKDYGTTILQLEISSAHVDAAQNGKEGSVNTTGYRGKEVLSTYAPLSVKGLDWVIIADKDYDEFIIPVKEFDKRMLIQTIIMLFIVTLLSIFLSRQFVKPIDKLSAASNKIIAGDSDHRVEINRKDEFGKLGDSFNTMIDDLNKQKLALNEQSVFNARLLENFVPKEFTNRLKNGEKAFAQNYTNLTLILVDIAGFTSLLQDLGPDKSIKILSEVMEAFDAAADNNKVERIRTIGDTYFGACGLFDPRLDHTNRSVAFALEVKQLIKEINRSHQLNFELQVSLTNGDVIAGIVGHEKFNFDVWGDSVNRVNEINEIDANGKILVSDNVKDRLEDLYQFEKLPETLTDGTIVHELTKKK